MGNMMGSGKGARDAARAQQELMEKQQQRELARIAEEEGEIARKRALAQKPGGRSLLIKTSPKGVQTLGGQ